MLGRAISNSKQLSFKKKNSFFYFFKRFRKYSLENLSKITYDGTEVDFKLAIDRFISYLNSNKFNLSFVEYERLQNSLNERMDENMKRLEKFKLPTLQPTVDQETDSSTLQPTVDQETDSSSSSCELACDSSTINNNGNLTRFIQNCDKLLRFLLLPDHHHQNEMPPIEDIVERKYVLRMCASACDVPIPTFTEWFKPVFKLPRPPKRRKKIQIHRNELTDFVKKKS